MNDDLYSPDTGEHIVTDNAQGWMLRAGTPAPAYDRQVEGCFWHNGVWVIVEAVAADMYGGVPQSITMRQARLALLAAGLLDDVIAAVAAMPQDVQIEWEYAAVLLRGNPLVLQVAQGLGWTSEQIDSLFLSAAAL